MKEMYKGVVNSPETTITNDISSTDTLIYVLDDSRVPDDLPNLMTIGTGTNAETVKVVSKVGSAITVVRGFQGVAKSWPTGSIIARNFTEYDYNALVENIQTLREDTDTNADDILDLMNYVGDLESLDTDEKANIVLALNEIYQDLKSHKAEDVSQAGGVHGLAVESGIFTPVLQGNVNPGVQQYAVQEGYYYRINKICFIDIALTLSFMDPDAIGSLVINGLPFANAPQPNRRTSLSIGRMDNISLVTEHTQFAATVLAGGIWFIALGNNKSVANLGVTDVSDNATVRLSGIYEIV